MSKAFSTHVEKDINHDGFQITFANGCTISVMFGKYTYSDSGETTAEVAAFHPNGNWMYHQEGDWIEIPGGDSEIMPRRTADEVAELIFTLSQYK
jgi:hypothetical protein